MTTTTTNQARNGTKAEHRPLPKGMDDARLLEIMHWMKLGRAYDQRAISLQRQGRSGTYGPMAGEEAVMVGSAMALDHKKDWIVPQYREAIALAVHGMPLSRHLLYLRGHPKGGHVPEDVNALPVQISVASQILHGVGLAWGFKLQKKDSVVVVYFGDGATSEGAFHEGANFAGTFEVPAVLLCVNNGWAISTPRSRQTASETIAQKAEAYGFPGVQVDGNDPLAVFETVRNAVERARSGGGPTLLEAITYRLGAHTTADDPTRYRTTEELAQWQAKDPLTQFAEVLKSRGIWDEACEGAIDKEVEKQIAQSSAEADSEPPPPPDGFFDHVFVEATARQRGQRKAFNSWRAELEK